MRVMRQLALFSILFFAFSIFSAEFTWETDLDIAKTKAVAEKKDLLIVYLGKDWDPTSQQLDKDVLSNALFKNAATKNFICVLVDIPKDETPASKEQFLQYRAEALKIGLSGFPTIVLMDTKGKVFGINRKFEGSTVIEFCELLNTLYSTKELRDEWLQKAAEATGDDKATCLNNALVIAASLGRIFDNWGLFGYEDVMAELIKADPTNKAGVSAPWDFRLSSFKARMAFAAKDSAAAMKIFEDLLARYPEDKLLKQAVYYTEAQFYAGLNDFEKCKEYLRKTVEIDPASRNGKDAAKVLEEINKVKDKENAIH